MKWLDSLPEIIWNFNYELEPPLFDSETHSAFVDSTIHFPKKKIMNMKYYAKMF